MTVLRAALRGYGIAGPDARYFCTKVVARRTWPGRESYSLAPLAAEHGIELQHHDALSDAVACAELALAACRRLGTHTLEALARRLRFRVGEYAGHRHEACGAEPEPTSSKHMAPRREVFDEEHPYFGRRVVFTGALEAMTRHDAMQLVVDAGGRCTSAVSGRSDFLVVGIPDARRLRGGVGEGKVLRAQELRDAGKPVSIVDEAEFLRLLGPDGLAAVR